MARGKRTKSFSARFSADVLEKLDAHSSRTGQSRARVAERMIDEGIQIEEFPGILFRSGPTGRRAGIVGGPDLWEIVRDLKAAARHGSQNPIETVAAGTGIDHTRIELAASYYAAYPDDIDERIRMNEEAVERLQRALGVASAT
jgi:predicted DNA-binding protein